MNPRMQRPFTALPQRQRGAVIVLIVIAMLSILAMAALALDGGHMLVNKTRLQNAVDAAALSGAKTLSKVSSDPNGYLAAEADARNTMRLNADADGNGELADAIDTPEFVIQVKFSDRVYGPFSNPPLVLDPRYVQVSVANYKLSEFFWGILQAIGDGDSPDKTVAAKATAGPSPTAAPCDLAPLVICGVPQPGTYYGYQFGDLKVLKTAASNESSIGPGNFQLLDFGSGGKTVGELLAGGANFCPEVGSNVTTKPGNTVGPSVSGVNTRFGEYGGSFHGKESTYPSDWVIEYDNLTYNDTGLTPRMEYQGEEVTSMDGDLSTENHPDLFDYNDWLDRVEDCPSGCESAPAAYERRILKVVMGDCTNASGGATSLKVLGFGCFFMVKPAEHSGPEAQIFGQFVEECEGDGVAGPTPVEDVGPQIIQLYKTYINGEPSRDS